MRFLHRSLTLLRIKIHPAMPKRFLIGLKTDCARREIRIHVCANGQDTGSVYSFQGDFSRSILALKLFSPRQPLSTGGNMYLAGLVGAKHKFLCSLNSLDIFNKGMGSPQTKKNICTVLVQVYTPFDYAGDQTQNLSSSSRMPFHWATRPISCLLTSLKIFIFRSCLKVRYL